MARQIINFHRCDKCSRYGTTSLPNILHHVRRHRLGLDQDLFSCNSTLKTYQCEFCPFQTDLKVRLDNHVDWQHKQRQVDSFEPRQLDCAKCGYRSHSQLVFANHDCYDVIDNQSELKHDTQPVIESGKRKSFECEQCSFTTKWRTSLKVHVICQHTADENITWFKCEQCSYRGKLKRKLREHIKWMHSDGSQLKWYSCQHCSFECKNYKSRLVKHMKRRHAAKDNQIFKCDKCPVAFTSDENINWFKCEYCPYRSKKKSRLKVHILCMHTNREDIEWFYCPQCSHKSKMKSSLTKHIKLQHGDRSFKCDRCDYQTKRKSMLKTHIEKMHSSNEYVYDINEMISNFLKRKT